MTDEFAGPRSSGAEQVGTSGIYPASGPRPPGSAAIREQGELGHPEQRGRTVRSRRAFVGNAALLALGRALFGGYFVYNGINHFLNVRTMTEYARSKQVPLPTLAVPATGTLILLGGLSVLAGYRPKLGATMIATFLLGVSPRMHAFWSVEDPGVRMQEMADFTKNMALLGAASIVAAVPEPWLASVRTERGALVAA